MVKYLYLTKVEWVDAWVNGGKVPLNLVSTYKSTERSGIYTPDEMQIDKSTHSLDSLHGMVSTEGSANIHIGKLFIGGTLVESNIHIDQRIEDGLVLSLCNKKSNRIASKLNKEACVRIESVEKLKEIIDSQLGVTGEARSCDYTNGHKRNHFLKSNQDSWQCEYRIFWEISENKQIVLPSGIAKQIKIRNSKKTT